jgi:putative molybdopterin biosynthesis protein
MRMARRWRCISLARRYLATITIEEAVMRTLEHVAPLDEEEYLPVHCCRGRVTTRPVFAKMSNPPFVCSAMDGYATRFEKTLNADLPNPVSLQKGRDAISINTGDPVPVGMDAVIMREDVEEGEGEIVIRRPAYLWQHVRMVGEDVIEGDMLLPANHTVRVFDLGMAISAGVTHVHVRRRPRLLIVPTGKELVDLYGAGAGDAAHPGRLIDFNSYTLRELAEEIGYEPIRNEIVSDKDTLYKLVEKAVDEYDVIIVNAGSSAGSEDFTEGILRELGEVVFHGVSMMPGKPTLFGLVKDKPVFGIPGYPVSAVLSFAALLEPLYERLCHKRSERKTVKARTPYHIPSRLGMEEVVRVNLIDRGGLFHCIALPRGASVFSSMASADALVRVPVDVEGYEEGAEVTCELLREEWEIRNRIQVVGSHDLSLSILRDMLKRKHPELDLMSAHVGSVSGISAMKKGVTDLSTCHVLDEEMGVYNIPIIKRLLPEGEWMLVHIAKRSQGLLVKSDNPKSIRGIGDLARPDVHFVNRQSGSGTRILLDSLLNAAGIEKGQVNGYVREESSHTAVGILVKESIADTAVGIYAVARMFSLGFVHLADEDYDLLVRKRFSGDWRFKILMELLESAEFKERLAMIGGYNTKETGRIKHVD